MSTPLVSFKNVEKRFGDFVAVRDLNLEIQKGEFVAIMGPSGCGKTTTLRMLAGLEKPNEGEIRLDGRLMNDVSADQRDTPLVWQSLALFPFLNVRQNVEFGLKMRGLDASTRKKKALKWLERMEIGELADRDVSQLSGGQRQRVALARSLVIEPEILLLDEPLSALDAHLVIRMQAVLRRLQRDLGITFFYVTHSQSEAFAMADRVVIMSQGQIEQIGQPKEIYRTPASRFVAEFVGRNNILAGKVNSISRGKAIIETKVGNFPVPVSKERGITIGDEVAFVISADLVEISLKKPKGATKIQCTILSEEFIGSVVTIFLEAEEGQEFKAQLQQRELEEINIETGQSIWLSWRPERAHILPK